MYELNSEDIDLSSSLNTITDNGVVLSQDDLSSLIRTLEDAD